MAVLNHNQLSDYVESFECNYNNNNKGARNRLLIEGGRDDDDDGDSQAALVITTDNLYENQNNEKKVFASESNNKCTSASQCELNNENKSAFCERRCGETIKENEVFGNGGDSVTEVGTNDRSAIVRSAMMTTSRSSSSVPRRQTFCGLVAAVVWLLVLTRGMIVVHGDTNPGYYATAAEDAAARADSVIHHYSSKEFSTYAVIQPKLQHARHKRDLSSTKLEDGSHADHITLSYKHQGNDVIVDLHLNDNLIPHDHFLRYQTPNGGKVVQRFTKTDIDLCHYKGTVRGNDQSRVALSTCNGVRGVIFDGDETFYLETKPNTNSTDDDHFLYRHSDMIQQKNSCGYESTRHGAAGVNDTTNDEAKLHKDSEFNRILRYKRSSSPDTIIRGPYNAQKHSSFVELVLVVDNRVYKALDENLKKVHSHCKDIANIINALYVPLNIFIALVGIVVWNENNEVELSSDGDKTLKNFLQYRRKVLVKDHPNDNAQLLTKEQFTGGVVGKALKGPICTYEFSGGVSMDHSTIVSVVATTVAHEMGHNFGMEHDTPDCKCVADRCIMSASSSSVAPQHWSSCSIDQLNLAFHQGMNYCLRNKPTKLFDSPTCGNGFVEPGEQCDCGLPEFCENTCCNPQTCMLRANASCATGECCDLTTCHPRTAGIVCRMADGECDLPEYCTGESEFCPSDYFKRDTEECDEGRAYCYQGSCRSHNDQCKILWGPSGKSSDQCYIRNEQGTRHGNCGYDRIANTYTNCSKADIMCGMLQCRHLNERLEFGMESVAVLSHSFISYQGDIIPCRTAIVDLGLQSIDPGLTPNGAKCDVNKMCVNQKCLSLESLRADGIAPECADNCSGHGVCDNKGACHCHAGFAPPLCNQPGPGGSEHSGPASNPNDGVGVVRVMYVFFLGVVPFISLILFFVYYWRQNRPLILRKSTNVLKSSNIKQSPQRGNGTAGGGHTSGGRTTPLSTGGITSTPSSTDDMNSALLRANESNTTEPTTLLNNNMFGHFKGFSLKPLPISRTPNVGASNVALVHPVAKTQIEDQTTLSNGVPNRAAPPVPKPPNVARSETTIKSVHPIIHRNNSLNICKPVNEAPALPPFNPGSTARPLISSPILEASTCSAKELISPLRHNAEKNPDKYPVRSAPAPPPLKSENEEYSQTRLDILNKDKKPKESTLKRIASFLKKDDSKNPTIVKVKPSLDKDKLKNIEISSPISTSDLSDSEPNSERSYISRTQSMREPAATTVVKRPNIQTFGSMRQPGGVVAKRPGSIVGGSRPKSPPPPRPPVPPSITNLKIPGVPGYQNPPPPKTVVSNEYDDCEAVETAPLAKITEDISPTNSDNIYSVIDEYQHPTSNAVISEQPVNSGSTGGGSMGLLGEIVNEIESRNLDSIYSVSTLNRKKQIEANTPYMNTVEINSDYGDSEYTNLKSSASTTSSGYLRPSAINTPIARVAPVKTETPPAKPIGNNLSSFRRKIDDDVPKVAPISMAVKPSVSKSISSVGSAQEKPPLATKSSLPATPAATATRTGGPFNRTKTPPSLQTNTVRTRSPSPTSRTKPTPVTAKPLIKTNSIGVNNASNKSNIEVANKSKPQPDVITSSSPANSTTVKPKPLTNKPDILNKITDKTPPTTGSAAYKPKWQSNKSAVDKTSSTVNSLSSNNKFGATAATPIRPSGAGAGAAATKASHVASLQQKFEGGNGGATNANNKTGVKSASNSTTLKK